MTVPVDRDPLRALAVLRYWFGDLEVLGVERGAGRPAPLDQPRLFLTIEAPSAQVDSRSGCAPGPGAHRNNKANVV
jgi:hypothetical protein